MSNSIFVPIRRLPFTLGEVQQMVYRMFEAFDLSRPEVQLHQPDRQQKPLADSIVTVHGMGEHEHCWISFDEYPSGLTSVGEAMHMGNVTTRGSWLFAAVVVLALFELGGSMAFNDSGELDGQPEYDGKTLRQVISDALASRNQYLAR